MPLALQRKVQKPNTHTHTHTLSLARVHRPVRCCWRSKCMKETSKTCKCRPTAPTSSPLL